MSDDAEKKAGKPEVAPAATTGLARRQRKAAVARQPAETRRFAACVVPEANRKIRALGLRHESLSQYLFFVDRLRDAPADKRRALVRDLRKAQANLASLLDEIDDIDK